MIGHEIGHGFDDQGRKSDGDGNLRDWWTAADANAFEARADEARRAVRRVSRRCEGMHINGELTMGENIGDLSGLAHGVPRLQDLARAASRRRSSTASPATSASSSASRRSGARRSRDEALRQQLLTDPHSPGMQRAFVPLVNNDAFYEAFDVKPGDKM